MNRITEKKAESTATKTGEAVSSGEYTLSEEGVRRYITNKGGRVTMQDVVEVGFYFVFACFFVF
jgi:hypothetical protein